MMNAMRGLHNLHRKRTTHLIESEIIYDPNFKK